MGAAYIRVSFQMYDAVHSNFLIHISCNISAIVKPVRSHI